MHARKPVSGSFDAANCIIHFNGNNINEYKWDIPSPQQLTLYRKLSDIVHDVESTLTSNTDTDFMHEDVINLIRDASTAIGRYMADYADFLWNEQKKLEHQLTDEYTEKHNLSQQEFDCISNELNKLKQNIQILVNCEYVWNVAEIFWIDAKEPNNSINTTLKFLDVMNKFRLPFDDDLMHNNIEFDSENYWKLLYKNAIYGKLGIIIQEIKKFPNNKISGFSKQLIEELCTECPLFNCLNLEQQEFDDDDDIIIPTKNDIIDWKRKVKQVMDKITETQRLLPLLQIFIGNTDIISMYVDDNWLDWICGYLFYNTPWMDHKNELRSLLTLKTGFDKTEKGSIEWMFGCIMSKEYESILYYVDARFPKWFGPHLCYFLRQLEKEQLILEWPRSNGIKLYDGGYNEYIEQHPKMTIIEWIFEYYVQDLLLISDDAWLWLKNYLVFFKRRGMSMLHTIFENVNIKNDKMAYLMLQCCDELNLDDTIYNMICLRMAQKSYVNNMQYGRITYWCCKCKYIDDGENEYLVYFNKYLAHLISSYLKYPDKYINYLHDVCDNANIDEYDDRSNNMTDCELFHLLSKLRDMYLCRKDLQELQGKYMQKQQQQQHQQQNKMPKATPFTKTRGLLIDALSKPIHSQNRNLKNIADSFDIAMSDSDHDMQQMDHNHNHKHVRYPKLSGRERAGLINNNKSSSSDSDSTASNGSGAFPKKLIARNQKKVEKATTDFLLQHLTTPPRPTPSRQRAKSHRKSSHKTSVKSSKSSRKSTRKKRKHVDLINDDNEDREDVDEDEDDDKQLNEEEKKYMMECCDIIGSYTDYLIEIISTEMYDISYFIRMIMFSLPLLSHKFAPNAVRLDQILLITHQWYKIKFIKNKKKTGIDSFSKNHELKMIQEILAHLQSKVLATTYSNKNYAEIWKLQEQKGGMNLNDDNQKQEEDDDIKDKEEMDSDDDDDDMIDID